MRDEFRSKYVGRGNYVESWWYSTDGRSEDGGVEICIYAYSACVGV